MQHRADRGRDILEHSGVRCRDEHDREVDGLAMLEVQAFDHLADRLAGRVRRQRVLGEGGGERHRASRYAGGRRVSGTNVNGP